MKLRHLGIFGIISLLSYTAMVVFSPLSYPGYDWLSMAVSDLSADGAPPQTLAEQLNALFGPCGIVSIMAVCVAVRRFGQKTFRLGIYFLAAMEWITVVGYKMFPLSQGEDMAAFQNIMHIVVTATVVLFSIVSLVLIAVGGRKTIPSLSVWAVICFAAMMLGAIGTSVMPKAVFGLVERFSTFSAVIFNAVLGVYLLKDKFEKQEFTDKEKK